MVYMLSAEQAYKAS